MMILAGDIGGTKTALALFTPEAGPRRPLAQANFPSGDYAALEDIVRAFLSGRNERVARASFGVAGPVVEGRVQVTNLPWVVDTQTLSHALGGVPVRLLNDLEAIAYAISSLEPSDLETLNEGQPESHGPLAVIAPGTGLGEAFLLWDGTRYRPHASEGGHADFAPTTQTEVELLSYLLPHFDHVSYERVCSGMGLPNVYAYLKDSGRLAEPDWLREQLASEHDPTPIIVQAALESRSELCVETLELFISILGSEAGNLALKVLATGGVYLAGGIPPRILSRLKKPAFMQSFTRKGRFSYLLARIPVHVILNLEVALLGVACHGLEPDLRHS
jgi:glucokinase